MTPMIVSAFALDRIAGGFEPPLSLENESAELYLQKSRILIRTNIHAVDTASSQNYTISSLLCRDDLFTLDTRRKSWGNASKDGDERLA
jgi:hypothetical protein